MQTVIEILKKIAGFLEKKGLANPRLNAELLMANGLDCKRLELYLRFEEVLSEKVLKNLRAKVVRRGKREPIQYILEEVQFMDLVLKVKKGVLIPRPETEELVEKLLKVWGKNMPKRILDLGTGSGALALALGYYCQGAEVLGVDIREKAVNLATANAKKLGLEDRVKFRVSDWFSNVHGKFDWIVANPPYLTEKEWMEAQPEVREYEPKGSLVAENEGMADLIKIIEEGKGYLAKEGGMTLETGIQQHKMLIEKAKNIRFEIVDGWKDLNKRERFLYLK